MLFLRARANAWILAALRMTTKVRFSAACSAMPLGANKDGGFSR